MEYLKDYYSLTDEEIDYIFDNYNFDYKDRAIVGMIWKDIEEASEEEAESLGFTTNENKRFFDYNKFGEYLLESEQYLELPDGKIVYFM